MKSFEEKTATTSTRSDAIAKCLGAITCWLVLSRLYELAAITLVNWRLMSNATLRYLYEPVALVSVHLVLILTSILIVYRVGLMRRIGSNGLAALSLTSFAILGHCLAAVFC